MRFHGARDIISVTDICHTQTRLEGRLNLQLVVFEEDWNILPHKLAVNCDILATILSVLFTQRFYMVMAPGIRRSLCYAILVLQDLLSSFTNLKQLFWTETQHISFDDWNQTTRNEREKLAQILGTYYSNRRHADRILASKGMSCKMKVVMLSTNSLIRLFHGDPEAQENVHLKDEVRFNLTQLEGVRIHPMLSVDPELDWLFKTITSE